MFLSQQRSQILMNISFIRKILSELLNMMMLHHELECDVKRFICYIPSHGYIEGSYNKKLTIFYHICWIRPSANKVASILTVTLWRTVSLGTQWIASKWNTCFSFSESLTIISCLWVWCFINFRMCFESHLVWCWCCWCDWVTDVNRWVSCWCWWWWRDSH